MKVILRHHTQRSATFGCGITQCNSGVPRSEATRHTSSALNQAAILRAVTEVARVLLTLRSTLNLRWPTYGACRAYPRAALSKPYDSTRITA